MRHSLARVFHELRTPLTPILAYSEILLDGDAGPLSEEQRDLVAIVERSGRRLSALIDAVVLMSRIESGSYTPGEEPVDLDALVAEVVAAAEPAAPGPTVHHHRSGPVVVQGDPPRLRSAVATVLSHAAETAGDGGAVWISSGTDGPQGLVEVKAEPGPARSPSGAGIPSLADAGVEGAAATALIEAHGGSVTDEDSEGPTTVTLRLPRAPAAVEVVR